MPVGIATAWRSCPIPENSAASVAAVSGGASMSSPPGSVRRTVRPERRDWISGADGIGSVPGAAGHPLFAPLFAVATLVNYMSVWLPGPVPVELTALAIPHLAFVIWLVVCDRGIRSQRTRELARFRELYRAESGTR